MQNWMFYPVFLGTAISIISLSRFALTQRVHLRTRTLSELATIEQQLLVRFRNILVFCGILFAITMFGFITPRTSHQLLTFIGCLAVVAGVILSGLVPAHKNTIKIHEALAGMMAIGMLSLPYLFALSFGGGYARVELVFGVGMTLLALLMGIDRNKKYFVAFELLFIFSSHLSIAIGALALR
jgi:hypothetical protein